VVWWFVRPESVGAYPAGSSPQPLETQCVSPLSQGREGEVGGDTVPGEGLGLVQVDDVDEVVIGFRVKVIQSPPIWLPGCGWHGAGGGVFGGGINSFVAIEVTMSWGPFGGDGGGV
jgi:hypothetical protein